MIHRELRRNHGAKRLSFGAIFQQCSATGLDPLMRQRRATTAMLSFETMPKIFA
jgi:hypothetical protein